VRAADRLAAGPQNDRIPVLLPPSAAIGTAIGLRVGGIVDVGSLDRDDIAPHVSRTTRLSVATPLRALLRV